jgi:(E)-4-hydroxy-3-methylbut-2-enyl-diphosphate synthase
MVIGGGAPVSIQSMTNKPTEDVEGCVEQIAQLVHEGCDLVRLTVPDEKSALCFGEIKQRVRDFSAIPMIADVHFDYRLALAVIAQGADKIRINPGNIGTEEEVIQVIQGAGQAGIPIRIGVNGGSLKREMVKKHGGPTVDAMVESVMEQVLWVEKQGFSHLILSVKSSDVKKTVEAYEKLSLLTEYPLHVGVTEAGTLEMGKIKSAAGIGALLLHGIGDTFRVSLTGDPVEEVRFGKRLLLSLGLRKGLQVISCPTCGRTKVDLVTLANQIENKLGELGIGKEGLTVAVMGCGVNGPGEAKEADFGVACGDGTGLLFAKGQVIRKVNENQVCQELIQLIQQTKK